jgi:hypothetical protein
VPAQANAAAVAQQARPLADSTNVQRGQNEGYNGKGKFKNNKKRRLDYGSSNDHAQQGSIIKHIGASIGYGQGGKSNHETSCAMVMGTFPPYDSMPEEASLRVVDYVNPVHNHVPVGACLAADGHIIHETRDSADNELEDLMAWRIYTTFVPKKSTFVPRLPLLFLHRPLLFLARSSVRTYV